ncbi:hypothetical protein V499_01064 [Pseudogymnoascus sp. VKM F-103]|nr:hypothetical protein V499_01064 [Pseudogymnoascus sp. VKM F-103]
MTFAYDAAHRVVVCEAWRSCVVPRSRSQERHLWAPAWGNPQDHGAAARELRPAERGGARGATSRSARTGARRSDTSTATTASTAC